MDACLETGVPYLDTACYEPPDEARYSHTCSGSITNRSKAGSDGGPGLRFDRG